MWKRDVRNCGRLIHDVLALFLVQRAFKNLLDGGLPVCCNQGGESLPNHLGVSTDCDDRVHIAGRLIKETTA